MGGGVTLPQTVTRSVLRSSGPGFSAPTSTQIMNELGGITLGGVGGVFLILQLLPNQRALTALGELAFGGLMAAASPVGSVVEDLGMGLWATGIAYLALELFGGVPTTTSGQATAPF